MTTFSRYNDRSQHCTPFECIESHTAQQKVHIQRIRVFNSWSLSKWSIHRINNVYNQSLGTATVALKRPFPTVPSSVVISRFDCNRMMIMMVIRTNYEGVLKSNASKCFIPLQEF